MTSQIIIGDCLTELPKLPPLSVDLVLCDLPYGVTQNAWDQIIDPDRMFAELHRVAKDSAPIILMATPSGGNCCPACGGSGGLVTEGDLEWGREEARKVLERDLRDGALDL